MEFGKNVVHGMKQNKHVPINAKLNKTQERAIKRFWVWFQLNTHTVLIIKMYIFNVNDNWVCCFDFFSFEFSFEFCFEFQKIWKRRGNYLTAGYNTGHLLSYSNFMHKERVNEVNKAYLNSKSLSEERVTKTKSKIQEQKCKIDSLTCQTLELPINLLSVFAFSTAPRVSVCGFRSFRPDVQHLSEGFERSGTRLSIFFVPSIVHCVLVELFAGRSRQIGLNHCRWDNIMSFVVVSPKGRRVVYGTPGFPACVFVLRVRC